MYLEHFRLEKSPFSLTPDPNFLFLTDKHREALAALLFAVTQGKGFMVMTGEAGTGKTTLVRKMLASVASHCAQFSVLVNPVLRRSELLESVLLDFGERDPPASKARQLALFREHLLRAHSQSKTCVLVVDEAHLLTPGLLEEIRLLANFETTEQKLLQIVLAGQQQLDNILNVEGMQQLRQRIAIRMRIEPLSKVDVGRYINTRWMRARSPQSLPFSVSAIQKIADSCAGIPRTVNVICDAALVNAYGVGSTEIGADEIDEVLRDLGLPHQSAGFRSVPEALLTRTAAPPSQSSEPSAWPAVPNHQRTARIRIPDWAEEAPALDRPSAIKKTVDNGLPSRAARQWRLANWFGTAGSSVK